MMKILVYQPDVSRIGGSIATILTFGDYFKELGHDVTILATWHHTFQIPLIKAKEDLIDFYGFKHLTLEDFVFSRVNVGEFDLGLTRGVLSIPTIVWAVVPQNVAGLRIGGNVLRIWTNSETSKRKMKVECNVIIPPHDYSFFRNAARAGRDIDLVAILRANEFFEKGIDVFPKVVKRTKLKGLLITTVTCDADRKRLDSLGVPYVYNISRKECAHFLGRSKILLHPSRAESCSLVIYEALNAGCFPITRNVGAVEEQLGGNGYIFSEDLEIAGLIENALHSDLDAEALIARGQQFDRQNIGGRIDKELKELFGDRNNDSWQPLSNS